MTCSSTRCTSRRARACASRRGWCACCVRCGLRWCIRATSARSRWRCRRVGGRPGARARRTRLGHQRPRRAQPQVPAGAPRVPAFRAPLRRAVRSVAALPASRPSACRPIASSRSTTASTRSDFSLSSGARASIDGSPFVDPALWLVGTVGRLQPIKDQLLLAPAFARAVRPRPGGARADAPAGRRRGAAAAADRADPARSAGVRATQLDARRARRCAGSHARPRRLRAAVARRRHLEHNPRGNGHRIADHRARPWAATASCSTTA